MISYLNANTNKRMII